MVVGKIIQGGEEKMGGEEQIKREGRQSTDRNYYFHLFWVVFTLVYNCSASYLRQRNDQFYNSPYNTTRAKDVWLRYKLTDNLPQQSPLLLFL